MNQTVDSSPDAPAVFTSPSNINDPIHVPSSMSQLPSGPASFGSSTNVLEGTQSNHTVFSGVHDLPLVALDMSADFPWTLEYTDFFSESHLAAHHPPVAQLGYSLSPFASSAEISLNSGPDNLPSQGPVPTREFRSEGERFSPTIQIQELRQSESPTPFQLLAMQATDDDIAMAENFCHVNVPLNNVYKSVFAFYEQQHDVRFQEVPFPHLSVFNSFIQLYYEHFDDQLPFIHPSLLEQANTPWILTLAVASVGCQYTNVAKRDAYVPMLTDLLRLSLPLDVSGDRLFCHCVYLTDLSAGPEISEL
ncbi:hypothetical protein N7476_003546 [Penicillium atrosanguineum]|uniref:Transcription factor domain-containing protein n=1 Tax=Penicillium atrosanguineum TaxID=1132637 RepID=A0A9W9U8J9_9EURO|nr:hypothetical protein N7476_003546 [Penicillium atrosanguineum]